MTMYPSRELLPDVVAGPRLRGIVIRLGPVILVNAAAAALVWWQVAPLPQLQLDSSGVLYVGGDSEAMIAADGWFAACAAVAGVITALVAFLTWRVPSLTVLAVLVVGGSLGALAAWRLGTFLGPPPVDVQVRDLAVGARFVGPLELAALGVLIAWPYASVVLYFALVAGLEPAPRKVRARGRRRRR